MTLFQALGTLNYYKTPNEDSAVRYLIVIHFILISLITNPAYAKLYKSIDEHGNVTYSDAPIGGNSETQELKPINIAPATETTTYSKKINKPEAEEHINYQVRIVSPESGTTLTAGQRNLHIALDIEPALQDGAMAVILLNGKRTASGQNSNLTIEEINRGAHNVSAIITNKNGKTVGQSQSITVNVLRPTIARP